MAKPTKIVQLAVCKGPNQPDSLYGIDQGGGLYIWDFYLCTWVDATDMTADAVMLRHQAAKHEVIP